MSSGARTSSVALLAFLVSCLLNINLQAQNSEQVEVGPPPVHRAEPPAPGATLEQLEERGDELRQYKNFLDAMDYYRAALKKDPQSTSLMRKIGICQLLMQHFREAKKSFEHVIHEDRKDAVAYNNLGVVFYSVRNYNAAIKNYDKAISLDQTSGSYFSNLGAAYFGKKQFDKAAQNYSRAIQLDPDIFERTSRNGVLAQLPSPEDRARYDYVIAKLYARSGVNDRSLHYLRKALEEGYKDIKNVYKDEEFSALRKDPRFAELMSSKPLPISD